MMRLEPFAVPALIFLLVALAGCQQHPTPAVQPAPKVARGQPAIAPPQAAPAPAQLAEAAIAAEKAKLLGVWQQYYMKLDGEDPPAGISQVDTWEFKEDTVGRPESPFGTWSIDPTRSPKHFQFQLFDKGPRLGLYELDGDDLTLCYGTSESHRPSAIKAGYGTVLLKFRRDANVPDPASGPIRQLKEGR